ncbi:MAG: inositol monophosphatase family protein [Candidatus Levyibacteriota bacterium]
MDNLQLAITAAKAAGEIISQGYSSEHTIEVKTNQSIVTEVDKASEETIIKIIEENSEFPILSEETRSSISDEETYWAIDPLDGTTNFARKIPFFAISIALISHKKPIVGVIFNPALQELYSSEEGKGTFFNGKKVKAGTEKSLVFVNTGYNKEHKETYAKINAAVSPNFTIRKMGSTACELAIMARGSADGFICWGDELWDHAAGILLVREAGGMVTDWKGDNWTTDTNYVLAGNKTIHPHLLKAISSFSN